MGFWNLPSRIPAQSKIQGRHDTIRGKNDDLLKEASHIGYTQVRLDSAPFMTEAHNLYRTTRFTEIAPYEKNEVTKGVEGRWVFMEKTLPGKRVQVNEGQG
jgi:hypothetical protein